MVKNPFKTGDADSIYGQGTKISLTTEQLEKLKGRPTLSKKKEKENPSSVPIHSVQFSSVAQSCPTLCDPMNCSTPGPPVHHQLPEFIQTHVHRVGDTNQPSHPLLSPSPPAPNPSQHQSHLQ